MATYFQYKKNWYDAGKFSQKDAEGMKMKKEDFEKLTGKVWKEKIEVPVKEVEKVEKKKKSEGQE